MKLTKNSKLMIAIEAVQLIIDLFSNTFLMAYFFNLTNNSIIPASIFSIFTFALFGIGGVVLGGLIKGKYKLLTWRLGFVINTIFLLLVALLRGNIISYIIPIGIIAGIASAMFQIPGNLLISQVVSNKHLVKFKGYALTINYILEIIAPVIIGFFIEIDSFSKTAIFIVFLGIAQFILSFFLSPTPISSNPFQFKKIWSFIRHVPTLKPLLRIEFLNGFVYKTIGILITLYVVYLFKTNLNLGIFTSCFAIFGLIINYLFGKFCSSRDFHWILFVCGILTFIVSSYFVITPSKLSLILYNFAFVGAAQLIHTIGYINMLAVSHVKEIAKDCDAEFLALRGIVLNSGRVISLIFVIIFAMLSKPEMLQWLILLFSFIIAVIAYLNMRLTKQLK